jgi:oligoribonuclease NrnB/cAMP/cGMP phosphodiesterase (DHH superfamily)
MEQKILEKVEKIREMLFRFNNPVYFFDNDSDGLCAFLLLRKWSGKGKGVAIKSFPELNESYARRISELNADSVFILDKPVVASGFIKRLVDANIASVWIDHHKGNKGFEDFGVGGKNFVFLNPTEETGINKPTTYWAYVIANKQLQWIAALGCLGDWYVPEFIEEVYKQYSDLFEISKQELNDVGKILYTTTFGKINLILQFGLKDKTSNIVKMINFLVNVNSPYEILEENKKNRTMHKRFKEVFRVYSKLLQRVKAEKDVVFFKYASQLSISAELANALAFKYPQKLIVVANVKGEKVKISVRGERAREITLKAIEGLKDASGGGHEKAVGANIRLADLPVFKKRIIELAKSTQAKQKQ